MSEKASSDRIKVANRITNMLCRLNEGKALDSKQLAQDYQVDRRTIQRDIASLREALPVLDLNEQGHYILPVNYLGQLKFDDIRHFSMLSGVSDLNGLNKTLDQLREKNLLVSDLNRISCTEHGHVFLNSVLEEFL